jgi:nitrate/nitrite transport system ATP-binding protein
VVLITNDVDEGLILADRIIPLTPGPAATLGSSVSVTLGRPRDRKALNHDPEFKRIRALVTNQLLDYSTKRKTTVTQRLILPDILPEDLDKPRVSRRPLRPHEIKNEEIAVSR